MYLLKLFSLLIGVKPDQENVVYGKKDRMVYDEFIGQNNKPIVIFWHGGSWQTGDKSGYRFVGRFFKNHGFSTILANYPKFPQQTFPGFVEDAHSLIAHVKTKYPNKKVYLCGHSSGGHTALIAGMTSDKIDGVLSLAAPHFFVRKSWDLIWSKIFDDEYESKKQNTLSYIKYSSNKARYLIIHGKVDKVVSPKYAVEFVNKFHKQSNIILLPMTGHAMILAIFLPVFYKNTKYQIIDFFGG